MRCYSGQEVRKSRPNLTNLVGELLFKGRVTNHDLHCMADFPTNISRIAIYARVSTDEQREGQAIDSQIAELERYAKDKGILVVGTYKDEGWSGGVMARPNLDRLCDDA